MHHRTIHDVVRDLDEIIDYARRTPTRIGYFAALYHHVGTAFDDAIRRQMFADNPRMERVAVRFFDRYYTAVEQHRHGGQPTDSWRVAFDAAERRSPTVITHLLLGMNAHINFDLGIAIADSVDRDDLADFEPDYKRMNDLLASVLGTVEDDLARIWPWLGWLHRLLGNIEDGIINFAMREARELAWRHAVALANLDRDARRREIETMDHHVALLAKVIWHPGPIARLINMIMRLEQRGSIAHLIDTLLLEQTKSRVHQHARHRLGNND